jgi:hypothetical protein
MSSRIKILVLVVGLAIIAVAGLAVTPQQLKSAVRTIASAVWGS